MDPDNLKRKIIDMDELKAKISDINSTHLISKERPHGLNFGPNLSLDMKVPTPRINVDSKEISIEDNASLD